MYPNLMRIRERLDAGERLTVCGLGDSLTFGWMAERGFFDRFCRLLGDHFPACMIQVHNEGVPGDTARGGGQRLPAILEQPPDLLVVQFGLNDFFGGISVDDFREDLTRMVRMACAADSAVMLATSSPLAAASAHVAVQGHYAVIRNLGHHLGVAVAVLERHWESWVRTHPPDGPLWLPDGVHPTDLGHQIMAEGLLDTFLRESS